MIPLTELGEVGDGIGRNVLPQQIEVYRTISIAIQDESPARTSLQDGGNGRSLHLEPIERARLLCVVLDSFDRVAKDLLQAHGRRAVGLAEMFVDLIAVIHPWSRKAD